MRKTGIGTNYQNEAPSKTTQAVENEKEPKKAWRDHSVKKHLSRPFSRPRENLVSLIPKSTYFLLLRLSQI